jgi:hypothetical protein
MPYIKIQMARFPLDAKKSCALRHSRLPDTSKITNINCTLKAGEQAIARSMLRGLQNLREKKFIWRG